MSSENWIFDLNEVDASDAFGYREKNDQQQRERTKSVFGDLTEKAYRSLKESGLSDEFIGAMRIKRSNQSSQHPDDYEIPYFDSQGIPISNYSRTRVFRTPTPKTPKPPKYIQTLDQPTRLYFPPNFQQCLSNYPDFIIFTEGEKKAASIAQYGLPAIGLGGVDSWRTQRLFVPADLIAPGTVVPGIDKEGQQIKTIKDYIIDLSNSADGDPAGLLKKLTSEIIIVPELEDLTKELARQPKQRVIYIVYDTDKLKEGGMGTKPEVQQSAFQFAYWLLEQGLDDIRMAYLPAINQKKVGLDDFVVGRGIDAFKSFLLEPVDEEGNPTRHTFPTHPTIRYFVHTSLNHGGRLNRLQINKLARAIVADLDARGNRYVSRGPEYYYYDKISRTLMKVAWGTNDLKDIRESAFGALLISRYGIGTRDDAILKELGDQFVYLRGIQNTQPRRVSYAAEDHLYYQVDDGTLAKISGDRISFHHNGYDNVLFLKGLVDPLFPEVDVTTNEGREAVNKIIADEWAYFRELFAQNSNRWIRLLQQTNTQPMPGMTLEETHALLSCHLYLAPWFRRWRNLMLPLELTQAEPSSGKSMFYQLRKGILTGRPILNRLPQDVRDWYASIIENDGLWVADNVGFMQGPNRQMYSDELARLITDLDPSVSMRKLFTTAEDQKFAVTAQFAMTSIKIPFTNEDIIQRSLMIHMKAIPASQRNGNMIYEQLNNGGRQRWIANHWLVFQRFLQQVERAWNPSYRSNHRLVNYEQALIHMGIALGYTTEFMHTLIRKFSVATQKNIASNNVVIKVLYAFGEHAAVVNKDSFTIPEMMDWISYSSGYQMPAKFLNSAHGWVTYFKEHAYDIQQSTGIQLIDEVAMTGIVDLPFYKSAE